MANTAQRSFAAGELTPAMYARTDQARYAAGLRTCRNMLVQRQGGATMRPGTEYIDELPTVGRMIPFVFNAEQSYVVLFTDQQIQIMKDGAILAATITGVSPYLAADLAAIRFVQSADVLTLVHPSYAPRKLSRTSELAWTLTTYTFAPSIDAPTNVALTPAASPGATFQRWVVTAVDEDGVESLASTPVGITSVSTPTARAISWDAVASAESYNVYKAFDAQDLGTTDFGFIGSTGTTSFYDNDITPDYLDRAPEARDPFSGAGNYPSAVGYYQERLIFGGSTNNPATIYASRTADYNNFTVSSPIQDDDAVTATLVSRQVNIIRHILDYRTLVALTSGGEWVLLGDGADILRPTEINAKSFGEHGVAGQRPLIIDQRLVYVHNRTSLIRDIGPDLNGRDLTIFASHLFDGFTISDWAYAEVPHSHLWVARSDGALLCLTIIDDQQVLGWSRHDTDGDVENVCCIPEGGEDRVYLIVNRDGGRYVERMRSLFWTDIATDAAFVDSMLSYDGRNTSADTMTLTGGISLTLTGGTTWLPGEVLTLTATAAFFASTDAGTNLEVSNAAGESYVLHISTYVGTTSVTGTPIEVVPVSMRGVAVPQWRYDQLLTLTCSGNEFNVADIGNQYFLYDATGAVVRFQIAAYTSPTVVTGYPQRTVIATLAGVATAVWSRAVDELTGLSHLEGQEVSVFADGFVVSSPNNPSMATITVGGGAITLDKPYSVIFVGLPYTADLETLDIDTPDGASLKSGKMLINSVTLLVDHSRGMWIGAGDPAPAVNLVGRGSGLREAKIRDAEDYDAPVDLLTGDLKVNFDASWNKTGRIFIRQVDPVPMTILAAVPSGIIPAAR